MRGNLPTKQVEESIVARKTVRRNRKRKNMAVKLFGAERDLVILLAGAAAVAVFIIITTMG